MARRAKRKIMDMESYLREIREWHEALETDLREENGWLALAGLYWLKDGESSFGAGKSNDIVLPTGSVPDVIGSFTLEAGKVKLQISAGVVVKVDGEAVRETLLQSDDSEMPGKVTVGDLTLMVVQRGDNYGIRLWDNGRPERETFPGRRWYPIQEAYRLSGEYESYDSRHLMNLPRNNGEDLEATITGKVKFTLHGEEHGLVALEESSGELFIIFGDLTNETETYPAGRYLYANPHENGEVTIDFNRAFTPPCAFTDYATCPFPPEENRLKIPIPAGEKRLHA
jgi:uncharacterized protein (DUF1684 family)